MHASHISRLALSLTLAASLAACGGGGGGSSSNSGVATTTYTITADVSGLPSGESVTLQSGATSKVVSADGSVQLQSGIASGASFDVTVSAQPSAATCTVSGGTGTVSANVVASVTCVAAPTNVVPTAGTLQTSAATPTYAASSQQLAYFDALNTARLAAGAGAVDQSAMLDTSSQAHATYETANGTVGHTEDPTKLDYYEADPFTRMTKAGFSYSFATEVIGGTGPSFSAADCALGLLDTVYHAAALLSQETYVGIGIGADGLGVPSCVSDLASAYADSYGQVPPSGSFIAYPYNAETNVPETFYVAYEEPRPSVTLFPNTTAGTPVIVRVRNADYVNLFAAGMLHVTVSQFVLKDSGGNVVPAAILAPSAMSGGSGVTLNTDALLGEGFAVLVPFSPLTKGQTYTASFSATLKDGGAALNKTWSFTTTS